MILILIFLRSYIIAMWYKSMHFELYESQKTILRYWVIENIRGHKALLCTLHLNQNSVSHELSCMRVNHLRIIVSLETSILDLLKFSFQTTSSDIYANVVTVNKIFPRSLASATSFLKIGNYQRFWLQPCFYQEHLTSLSVVLLQNEVVERITFENLIRKGRKTLWLIKTSYS